MKTFFRVFFQVVLWVIMFIPSVVIELACMLLAPVVALPCFVVYEDRTDRVKRLENKTITLPREYLVWWLRWFQTHDNAVDEYWWGLFTKSSIIPYVRNASDFDYPKDAFLRYLCRVLWLWRNCAYGFHYHLLSRKLDDTEFLSERGNKDAGYWHKVTVRHSSWQVKANIPIIKKLYVSLNFGWKKHDGFDWCMYANRIISFRMFD